MVAPPGPFSSAQIDQLMTAVWLAAVMSRAGTASPDGVERKVRRGCGMTREVSHNFRQYAKGEAPPFKRTGPRLRLTRWPDRVEAIFPGTRAWLTTPFWFLIERAPTYEELLICVRLLPERYQEALLTTVSADCGVPIELDYVSTLLSFEFADNVSPSALGAMACAMHRGRLSGDMRAERRFVVAITWMLFRFAQDGEVRSVFERVLHCFLWWATVRVYPTGLHMPVSTADLALFARRRDDYLAWDPSSVPERFSEISRW